MDDTDLAILREMFFDRVFRFGGLDPRISARQIANELGLSHTAVSTRLQSWVARGFFGGQVAFPNPELIGRRFYGIQVLSNSVSAGVRVRAMLPDLDSAVLSWEQGEGNMFVTFLGRGPREARAGARRLRTLARVTIAGPVNRIALPPSPRAMHPVDWNITRAIRGLDTVDSSRIAEHLGIGPKMARRRINRLIDEKALLFLPRLDHARGPGVLATVRVDLREDAGAGPIWGLARRIWPVVLPMCPWDRNDFAWDLRSEDPGEPRFLMFFVTGSSPTDVSRRLPELEEMKECSGAWAFFPARLHGYPAPFDPFIEAAVQGAAVR